MKKIAVLIIALIMVTTMVSAAEVGAGSLNVYGLITASEVVFNVEQIQTIANRINLKDSGVNSTSSGVVVGRWSFEALNQGSAITYTLTYAFPDLTIGGVVNASPIPFQILEYNDGVPTVKSTGNTTTIAAQVGNNTVERNVAVRLTAAGVAAVQTAPASNDYESTITLTLTAP